MSKTTHRFRPEGLSPDRPRFPRGVLVRSHARVWPSKHAHLSEPGIPAGTYGYVLDRDGYVFRDGMAQAVIPRVKVRFQLSDLEVDVWLAESAVEKVSGVRRAYGTLVE